MNFDLFLQLEPHVTNGMSTFQMENFVINDSITPYRKLRQALIEAKTRVEVLTSGNFDLQETEIKLARAKEEAGTLTGYDRQLKDLEVKRLEYTINRATGLRKQQTREVEFFMGMVAQLVESIGGVEKAIELLNDPKSQIDNEQDYWIKRLSRSVYSDFVNFGTISKGVVESIACLPLDTQKEIIQQALGQQQYLTDLLEDTKDTLLVNKD